MVFYTCPYIVDAKTDKAAYLSLLFKYISSVILSISLWRSVILLFWEFIYIVFLLCYNCFEFIILICTFSVIYFSKNEEDIIWRVSLSKSLDVLPAFTCMSAMWNFWSIWLGGNVLSHFSWSFCFIVVTCISLRVWVHWWSSVSDGVNFYGLF